MDDQEGRRKTIAYIVLVLGIVNILFIGILISKARITKNTENTTDATPTPAIFMTEDNIIENEKQYTIIDIGQRKDNTVEEIKIIANPPHDNDNVAVLRWAIKNGTVKEFKSEHISLGSCDDQSKFNKNKLCVDVSKPNMFKRGDVIGTVTIEWGESGSIFRSPEDGYYNGKELSPGSYQ